MFRFPRVSRSAIALIGVAVVAACTGDSTNKVLGVRQPEATSMFQSYVALGNSITAGYQSGGIDATGQAASYANLLSKQMITRFAIPLLASVGCPPPVINFQTQARPTGTTSTTCALRNPASATDILNNVAVPNASSYDPTATNGTPFSNILTSLFLGGKTQVQKALEASPTFATIWIGNNDVLGFALSDGRAAAPTGLQGMTPTATFTANYDAMISQLTAGAPGIKGVLIGVVQVANAPIMFPGGAFANAIFKAGFDAIACSATSCAATGGSTLVDPSCTTAPAAGQTDYRLSLVNTFLAFQIRTGAHPSIVSCRPGGTAGTFPAPVGDILILDPAEQTTIQTRIDSYNTYIQTKANSIGFAYLDPNPILVTLKAGNTIIRQLPNFAATGTFGTGMSLDGVHPAAAVHREIANALIPVINTKYGTSLALVP